MNKVLLIGHVGKTPEIRYLETPDHPKVAQMNYDKLKSRADRGKLSGDGDNR